MAKDVKEEKLNIITVRAAKPEIVGVWEVDLAHKEAGHADGEVFVSGEKSVKVARTPLVNKKLQLGDLVEV
ncbi:MAG: hypothetical protein JOZ52_08390 [Acidobacteria bacterium]|nr:hypothetical protein [Acidobacteriota bacterium]